MLILLMRWKPSREVILGIVGLIVVSSIVVAVLQEF
jgi:hypothetical protein